MQHNFMQLILEVCMIAIEQGIKTASTGHQKLTVLITEYVILYCTFMLLISTVEIWYVDLTILGQNCLKVLFVINCK